MYVTLAGNGRRVLRLICYRAPYPEQVLTWTVLPVALVTVRVWQVTSSSFSDE